MYGLYEKLMHELNAENQTSFKNFLRVDPDIFTELQRRVGPRIEKQDTYFRKAIPSGLKLAVTLRYLATGDSSVTNLFRTPSELLPTPSASSFLKCAKPSSTSTLLRLWFVLPHLTPGRKLP